jgi:hypothetical protein
MGAMSKVFFANMEWTGLPLFALVLFMVMFALVIARTWGLQSRSDFDAVAATPLADDDQQPAQRSTTTEVTP